MALPRASGPKTSLAEIYSHLTGVVSGINHTVIRDNVPFKSGLTPIYANPYAGFDELVEEEVLQQYQRDRFHTFTTEELEALESLAFQRPVEQPENLDGLPIHDIFRRENWAHPRPLNQGSWPIGLGTDESDGFWDVNNNDVWNILQPCLKLATVILTNHNTSPWWDAFLMGARRKVDQADVTAGKPGQDYYRFFRRTPADANSDDGIRDIQERLFRMGSSIEFDIVCGCSEWSTGLPTTSMFHGITVPKNWWHATKCCLDLYDIQPLLNKNMHPAERLLSQFSLASTILHELAHALHAEMTSIDFKIPEPYFEDECLAELGFSMENALCGGMADKINDHTNAGGLPYAGFVLADWNTLHNEYRCEGNPTIAAKPSGWLYERISPVPVEYFQYFHDTGFWNYHVRGNGPTATHMGPLPASSVYIFGQGQQEDFDEIPTPGIDPVMDDSMTVAQKTAVLVETRRNATTRRIQSAMQRTAAQRTYRTARLNAARASGTQSYSRPNAAPYLEPIFTPLCPRFDLIVQFLFSRRQELALDTLHFTIAEHQLYWYIVREGFISPTPREWRGFLQRCTKENVLFRWKEYLFPPTPTQGTVVRVANGWPIVPPPIKMCPPSSGDSPAAVRFRTMLKPFKGCMTALGTGNVYEPGQYDADKRVLLIALRKIMKLNGWTSSSITDDEFDDFIRYYEFHGRKWGFGPAGIIRKTEFGW
ncbi:uncharacterized protein LY89DRAFT_775959 [Mollisia scopiformis]|uniref:Uncharacterized protein n=1 Tax=Mollisia scopiformis TaxID=149040 RepID=A0A194XU08_MOLSC|nr:uncharacterized protein LY89DRAFT_775959 [Mollisia scopiformis]KUJ23693.1 hypothetical protein LY89DRAFT_775959 [Mollisia scopiformis]